MLSNTCHLTNRHYSVDILLPYGTAIDPASIHHGCKYYYESIFMVELLLIILVRCGQAEANVATSNLSPKYEAIKCNG